MAKNYTEFTSRLWKMQRLNVASLVGKVRNTRS